MTSKRDIVERLREWHEASGWLKTVPHGLVSEAADEIARLRAETPTGGEKVEPSPVSGEVEALRALLADALSGLRYIEQRYGRLDGVGWDRVLTATASEIGNRDCGCGALAQDGRLCEKHARERVESLRSPAPTETPSPESVFEDEYICAECGCSLPCTNHKYAFPIQSGPSPEQGEVERLREALEEIARMGCENWPDGHSLTCRCNPCIARRALSTTGGTDG